MTTTKQIHELILSRVSQLSRLSAQHIEKVLLPKDISLQEFRIVGLLIGDDDITQKELAEKLSVRPATLSVAISKLEKRGIVKRVVSTLDKRINYLHLRGDAHFNNMRGLVYKFEQQITENIDPLDLETTRTVLTKLIANLNQSDSQEKLR